LIDRRTFLASSTLGLGAPRVAAAQRRMFRIGILGNVPVTDPEGKRLWGALIEGLRELGYVEGQNIRIEHRSSEGQYERLPQLAAELVRKNVDVIVAPSIQNVLAVDEITRAIPVVVTSIGDSIPRGLIASLAHPGGHVTGLSLVASDIVGKQLELLRELVPGVSRVSVLSNPTNPTPSLVLQQAILVAPSLSMQLHFDVVREPAGFEPAFAAMTRRRAGAVLVVADGMFLLNRDRIANLAARARLPTIYGLREHVEAGGLFGYGASLLDNFRRAATYVDKVLKGARPADLPIEQPTKFALVINLKAARALGLTIPPSLLARADHLIE
jgi:putative ABC transport system substrate-binding protein